MYCFISFDIRMTTEAGTITNTREQLMRLHESGLSRSGRVGANRLDALFWEIHEGERWVVSGLHASGKSSLLKAAAGLLPLKEGALSLFGVNYWQASEEKMCSIRRKISFVFEDADRLIPRLTLAENIALPLCYHENKELSHLWEELKAILEYLRISSLVNYLPTQLTLYQKQLAVLAQALLIKPQLLFWDNFGEGLDVIQRFWLKRLLRSLSLGITSLQFKPSVVVVATQNLEDFLDFGTHYGVITEEGFLVFKGVESLKNSENSTVKKLLGERSDS